MSIQPAAADRPRPTSTTPVLLNRPIRPNVAPERLPRFGDDRWDLTPGIFEDHSNAMTINFTRLPQPWRDAVKAYIWQLINEDHSRQLPSAQAETRNALRSIAFTKGPIERLIHWAIAHGQESLAELDAARLDAYLAHLADTGTPVGQRQRSVAEVRRLWAYRDAVPPLLAMPEAPPWAHATASDLLGTPADSPRHNRTPRIGDATLLPLLAWAIRIVEEISADILPNYTEFRAISRNGRNYRQAGRRVFEPQRHQKLNEVIEQLRAAGLGLPGQVLADGSRQIRWSHLARLTGSLGWTHVKYDRDLVESSGLPIDDDAYLTSGCNVAIDGVPWHPGPMRFDDVVRHVIPHS
jgi:hypothetical protein